jgi:hypothetical protein
MSFSTLPDFFVQSFSVLSNALLVVTGCAYGLNPDARARSCKISLHLILR